MGNVVIEPASLSDQKAIESLLRQAQLPSEDIAEHLNHFLVAKKTNKIIGAVGLQTAGKSALLRSLVVEESLRGKGLGKTLYDAVVQHAAEVGVRELGLLTTTAEQFFARAGFRRVESEHIPEFVKATKEYRIHCPSSAVCMVKRI